MPLVLRISLALSSLALSSKFIIIHLLAIIISQEVGKGGEQMKRQMELRIHLESVDKIKELLPQIATLQTKYDVHLIIDVCETRTAI